MNAVMHFDKDALSSSFAEMEEVSMITLVDPLIPNFSYSSIKSHPSCPGMFKSKKMISGVSPEDLTLLRKSIAWGTLLIDSTSSANLACLMMTELIEFTISSSSIKSTFL